MAETPEEFEERMDEYAALYELAAEVQEQILEHLDLIKTAVKTHGDLMRRLNDIIEG